jgi:hypothetical protein
MAACLACGDCAVISHVDAAFVFGIARRYGRMIHVTTPERGRASRPGIRLHRVRSLHPGDRSVRDRIPVTSLARTLLDLAEIWDRQRLGRAFEEADRLGLLDLRAIDRVCERARGRRGLRVLKEVRADHRYDGSGARTELERRFLDFCRDAGLPEPSINVLVEGFEVDGYWPGTGLVVELDSYEFHRTRAALERDHMRDAVLKAAGYEVVRITWRMLEREAQMLSALLGGQLRARS